MTVFISFVLLLILVIISMQNPQSLAVEFLFWKISMSFTAFLLCSAVLGAAIVSFLMLPKLITKSLQVRKLNKAFSKKKALTDKNKLSDE